MLTHTMLVTSYLMSYQPQLLKVRKRKLTIVQSKKHLGVILNEFGCAKRICQRKYGPMIEIS